MLIKFWVAFLFASLAIIFTTFIMDFVDLNEVLTRPDEKDNIRPLIKEGKIHLGHGCSFLFVSLTFIRLLSKGASDLLGREDRAHLRLICMNLANLVNQLAISVFNTVNPFVFLIYDLYFEMVMFGYNTISAMSTLLLHTSRHASAIFSSNVYPLVKLVLSFVIEIITIACKIVLELLKLLVFLLEAILIKILPITFKLLQNISVKLFEFLNYDMPLSIHFLYTKLVFIFETSFILLSFYATYQLVCFVLSPNNNDSWLSSNRDISFEKADISLLKRFK